MSKTIQDLIAGGLVMCLWTLGVYLFARYLPPEQSFMCVVYAIPIYYLGFYAWMRFVAIESEVTCNCMRILYKKPVFFQSVPNERVVTIELRSYEPPVVTNVV
jgi:hypothetical protein